ncbi:MULTISPECIES: sulfate/molybdate ABC transporter ATP-binding protein [Prauserella salsuginis group]|uniref:Molybdate transport system ATP-binding protein n=2 Tax=Prauserella salsuginis group TaxID=2893672 RepID=A0A839XHL5_9PSEU|nr:MULTISPECIES: ABC transporter ATP-binding protein [Prauserella salsuginis group]MBB3663462.1 molybdate transport system ATP-binding protein [Prauserella sediminis]MCR3720718.1 molybdate transport system ATP-binding protein [Prauserella flava]MCR3735201.1 molybdate transport system ATP-binding protein [Prauserella salsuginis]
MSLHVDVAATRGRFTLDVAFDVPGGGVLAVLGPNGSGKSTLLQCLAGLLVPDRGTVTLGERTLSSVPGVQVPVHDRGIGLLAQDPLLLPHLTVAENVAFGPRSQGSTRTRARAQARAWIREVDAVELAGRKPAQLSGGQAQRVAIARALAGRPRALLLDEPLSALDVDAAPAVRGLLRRVLRRSGAADDRSGAVSERDRCAVLVTHDPLDALALADDVVVLDAGRIVERGPAKEVLAAPRTPFTARIAGLNLVPGVAAADGLHASDGRFVAGVRSDDCAAGEPAVAVFAPGAVAVHPAHAPHTGSPRNVVDARVASLEPHGAVIRLRTAGDGGVAAGIAADLTPASVAELGLEPGSAVRLEVKAASVAVHAAVESPSPFRAAEP